jgi:hypothetical protein
MCAGGRGAVLSADRRIMKKLSLLCLAGGWASVLCAQSAAPAAPAAPTPRPVLPSGPLLERAPEFSQWTITSKTSGAAPVADGQTNAAATAATPAPAPAAGGSPGQKAPPSPTDLTITVIKTKNIRFEQTEGTGAGKLQKWCFPDMQLTVRGRGAPIVSLNNTATHSADYTDYSKSDFSGFGWIAAKNFTGIVKTMGQDCLVFKDKVKLDAEAPGEAARPAVACIAVESRLPVALQVGDEVRTYQFGAAPTDMLVPPPDIGKVLEKWRKSIRQAALPPTKP